MGTAIQAFSVMQYKQVFDTTQGRMTNVTDFWLDGMYTRFPGIVGRMEAVRLVREARQRMEKVSYVSH